MSINKVSSPQDPLVSTADWTNIKTLVEASHLGQELPVRVDYDNDLILSGAIFCVGGSFYRATSNTAITGTKSRYVKLTVSGDTLIPSYVSSLSSVSWNDTYLGYYDVSGNFYIFDYSKEYFKKTITTPKTIESRIASNTLKLIAPIVANDWTTRTSATNNNWCDVCWSPDLSLFVAVAETGTGDRVMTSLAGLL